MSEQCFDFVQLENHIFKDSRRIDGEDHNIILSNNRIHS